MSSDLDALYSQLDTEIARSKDYERIKEQRIVSLKRDYDLSHDRNHRTAIINQLIKEFDAYNADSALYYVSYNLRRPAVLSTPGEYTKLLIKRADIFAHAGLFADALATMKDIPADSVTDELKEDYFSTYCATYQYLSEYTDAHETAPEYIRQRSNYADSLNRIIRPDSFNHTVYIMSELARSGKTDTAITVLSDRLNDYQLGTREYSILASTLAYIYKLAGYSDEYKRHLVLSAISDVKGAVKENMSFREVATVMFEDGDIERANRYLKKSIADANFYSALMRNAQSSKMLPIIDEAYTAAQDSLHSKLRTMVALSSVLSFILIITIILILKQIKSIRAAKDRVSTANDELNALSQQLQNTNAELKATNNELEARNDELRDFNKTKEQYAGLFMEYCSTAISTLQHYQQSLRNLAIQGANKAKLLNKLESSEIADQLLKNFYVKFDEAILNIYPSFIDKFNALLLPGEKVSLKAGELLNTELRLYALIRIGIDDNAKIAEFLRCSISTVYTYRSRMKKRAINPAGFEAAVKNIG
ncbi:MAG: hypothetical protein K2M00_07900 [Muribaculaceae bacterium]|nr:hypothetical protein [Muribaculaceae bacterium]